MSFLMFRLDMDLKDHEGNTALWLALQYITVASDPSINPFDDDAPVVNGTSFDENSFAARLIQRGSDPNAPDVSGKDSDTSWTSMHYCLKIINRYIFNMKTCMKWQLVFSLGNCLIQRAALAGSEAAAIFLATHEAKVNHTNKWVSVSKLKKKKKKCAL